MKTAKTIKITIESRHCKNSDYMDNFDCPVCRAVKEQHPEFPIRSVGGEWVRTKDDEKHHFSDSIWNSDVMKKLSRERIKPVILTITLNNPPAQ